MRHLSRAVDEFFFEFADSLGWVQAFRANVNAVHDRVATEQAVRVFQIVQALGGGLIAAVGDEAIRGEQASRTHEFVRVPPEAWAAR